jgi:outer membrane protein insertion porin family
MRRAMWRPAIRQLSGAALLVVCLLVVPVGSSFGQADDFGSAVSSVGGAVAGSLRWAGLPILRISYEGVPANRLKPLDQQLQQAVGTTLSSDFLKNSLRQLYATGLYDSIEVEGEAEGNGVALIFSGQPRMFIGTVSVDGAKGATANTQLERASQLAPGTPLTDARLTQAIAQMKATLASNGYPDPVIKETLTMHPDEQLTDISFHVNSGEQARVGSVEVTGEAGMSAEEFRHAAHLKAGAHVDHDTVNRALDGVLKKYQNQDRLEAEVKLASQKYSENNRTADFQFSANRGPVVRVIVEGAGIESDRVRRLVPIFEEGSVDEDLLNEGNRRLRDYYQRLGYFDVKVSHDQSSPKPDQVNIVYTVELGPRRRVEHVLVSGNHYFDSATLEDMLSVHAATALDRHGAYNQALVSADVSSLEAVYRNNGFAQVKITPETSTPETAENDPPGDTARQQTAPLTVTYQIDEGPQMRVGAVHIEGNAHMNDGMLLPLLNTAAGQLLSPQNLAGDRDALLTVYLSRGFNQATVDIRQQAEAEKPSVIDVTFHIHEGEQIFVRDVLLTGIHYTRMSTVTPAITVHAGDPLNQSALLDTQRNLYTFALFNEVNTAIENPEGAEPYKTVMLQAVEARRWTLTYGFGFEAQTGQPQNNCAGAIAGGVKCDPNGKTGVSPRVLADITRNNVFGREQSASLQGTYGLLEQRIQLLYQIPTIENKPNLGLSFSGGYANSQDVTTYVASRLDGGFRLNQSFVAPGSLLSKANTFIYELNFRRVKVAASSLQVYPAEIPELATAVRVSGPSFTWIRDTRDSAMDAHRGTYTSFQEFLSAKPFGSQAQFDRIDTSNSSYYGFDKGKFVLARNTRYGQVRAFGTGFSELIPLPERLYAGGPTSMRGFSQNAAGPRDPETGFPIGGAGALINSTELRLPPPTLPWLGNTVSFVLFHDMGNVFANASDAWESALRIHQPDRDVCKSAVANPSDYPNGYTPGGHGASTGEEGNCSFNYFSHTPGLGVRYHTPVGPIRFDFSYNLNPPIYPVNIDYSIPTPPGSKIPGYATDPRLGQAPHFNFFFSLGQSF